MHRARSSAIRRCVNAARPPTVTGMPDTPNAAALEALAHRALDAYGLQGAQVAALGLSDNSVYRVTVASGARLALRLHTAARHAAPALASELEWLDHLSRAALPVPAPVRSAADEWVVRLEDSTLYTALTWLDGEPLAGRPDPAQAGQMGALLARLHLQAERFTPPPGFTRPEYSAAYFQACGQDLTQTLGTDAMPPARAATLHRHIAALADALGPLQAVPGGYGLIHADAHPGNFLLGPDGPSVLDFDRCGFGPYLLDVAGATLDLEVPERDAFLAGYAGVRALPEGQEAPTRALKCLAAVQNLAFLARRPHERPFVLEALPHVEGVIAQVLA